MSEDSKAYFEEVAQEWDKMRQTFFSEAVREKAFIVAKVESGKTAADIGAGTGFLTEGLINKNLKVIAVDQSPAMLDEMKRRFQNNDLIDYRLGESENLPVDENTVDYAFANMYLHHVENPDLAIKEMARILKPGGKLVITDLDEHQFSFLKTEHHDRWMGFKREAILRWLTDSELNNVGIDCVGENCYAESCCGGEKAAINIFIAWGEKS